MEIELHPAVSLLPETFNVQITHRRCWQFPHRIWAAWQEFSGSYSGRKILRYRIGRPWSLKRRGRSWRRSSVFKLSEVDEMIENRFQAGDEAERCFREDGL